MGRSKWKGNFIEESLLKNTEKRNLKIFSRRSVIPSFFIGKKVLVYSGKNFKKFL